MNTDKKSQLVLLLLDGEISEKDFQTLQTWLLNDEETRRIYQDHVMTEYLMEKGSSFVSPSLKAF